MTAQDQIGKLATADAQRDAIHVAIAPVVADGKMDPGDRVGLLPDGTASLKADLYIGIVDPYLPGYVNKGERFYLFLYPNTVTSLRHEWTHPAFPPDDHSKRVSESWLRNFCDISDCPRYETVIAAITGHPIQMDDYGDNSFRWDEDYLHFNGLDAHSAIPPEFWVHIEIVTGMKIPAEKRSGSFSCSC